MEEHGTGKSVTSSLLPWWLHPVIFLFWQPKEPQKDWLLDLLGLFYLAVKDFPPCQVVKTDGQVGKLKVTQVKCSFPFTIF